MRWRHPLLVGALVTGLGGALAASDLDDELLQQLLDEIALLRTEQAELRDGWGWNFWARGNLPEGQRSWVHIDDQVANPWGGERPVSEFDWLFD